MSQKEQSVFKITFICSKCGEEMEAFKIENTYEFEIVCLNCPHTKTLPISLLSTGIEEKIKER